MLRPVNLTVAAVFAAFSLIYIPRLFVLKAQTQQPEGLDNANPRAQQAKLDGIGARALGAHNNAFEAFAPFAAAALFCRYSPSYLTSKDTIDAICGVHVLLRLVYTSLYIGNIPTARTAVWVLAQGATTALFYLAFMGG